MKKKERSVYFFFMGLSMAIMLLQLLLSLTEHGVKDTLVTGEDNFILSGAVGIKDFMLVNDVHLQLTTKTLVEQIPRQSVWEMHQIMAVSISIISDSLKKIAKVIKKLRNSNDPLLDLIVTCVGNWNGSFMIILNDPLNVFIMTKPPPKKKFQKQNGDNLVLWYWCYPLQLSRI